MCHWRRFMDKTRFVCMGPLVERRGKNGNAGDKAVN